PNIVLVLADDLGFSDLGCYGGEIATPHIDRLAERGLRFTQFYNAARCCPSRASLLTGLYPHQAGIGHMVADLGHDGYRGDLGPNTVTIAEVLARTGYQTMMAGKWHVTKHVAAGESNANWPLQRGFEQFYGTLTGAGSYWDPFGLMDDNHFVQADGDYYYTEAITGHAVDFIRESSRERPFFLYVAYTAPHYPMHAWPEDIQKYRHKYQAGWQALRQRRYEGLDAANVFPKLPTMAPVDEQSPAWETLTAEQQDAWDLRMAVYAAMIDRMDQNIGRLLAKLDEIGKAENTVVMFFSDNGGESDNSDWSTDKAVVTGGVDSFRTVGQPWANASNTPFRKYKTFLH
ncbi:MAG: sulfatase-like hydrolase/transferase, partial [Planctomycetales bacterium]|nr:sulfatase-like hydrolase/transferase [Planctomycetales bacterium]